MRIKEAQKWVKEDWEKSLQITNKLLIYEYANLYIRKN